MAIYLTILATVATMALISLNQNLIRLLIEIRKMNSVKNFFNMFKQ